MLFGHNSNVKIGETLYHVQTEDRGTSHAVIDTMVYHCGRVLHRRANSYFDLLRVEAGREEKLKQRVRGQHHAIVEELRSGTLKLAQHTVPAAPAKASADGARDSLALELLNVKNWLAGRRATLQVRVSQKENGAAVSGARVTAHIEGADEPAQYSTATGLGGNAQLAFDIPRLAGSECAPVIEPNNART